MSKTAYYCVKSVSPTFGAELNLRKKPGWLVKILKHLLLQNRQLALLDRLIIQYMAHY